MTEDPVEPKIDSGATSSEGMRDTETEMLDGDDVLFSDDGTLKTLNCRLEALDGEWECDELASSRGADRIIADMDVNVTSRTRTESYSGEEHDQQYMILTSDDPVKCRYEESDRGTVLRCLKRFADE